MRSPTKDRDPRKVGRRFSNATMELALGGYAGFHTTTPPAAESAYGVYWPALIPAAEVEHTAVLPDGTRVVIPATRAAAEPGWGIKLSLGRTSSSPLEPEGSGTPPGEAGLVAERGYHEVPMSDIGAAAGIVGSGIYRHFDGKSAVLVALSDQVIDDLTRGSAAILARGLDPSQTLTELIEAHVRIVLDDRTLMRVYHSEIASLPGERLAALMAAAARATLFVPVPAAGPR